MRGGNEGISMRRVHRRRDDAFVGVMTRVHRRRDDAFVGVMTRMHRRRDDAFVGVMTRARRRDHSPTAAPGPAAWCSDSCSVGGERGAGLVQATCGAFSLRTRRQPGRPWPGSGRGGLRRVLETLGRPAGACSARGASARENPGPDAVRSARQPRSRSQGPRSRR